MIGRTNTGGGGGGLNFKVVGGTTAPTNPKENMIWVNTDQKITSWIFIATEPTEHAEGLVWFLVGDSSPVEFNALKKNRIQVYPISAKQYISGSWVDVAAKVYHDGEWKQMIPDIVLYDRGNEYATITKSGDGTVTKYSDYIQIKTSNAENSTTDANISGVYDLTNYKTLVVEYKNITQTTNFQVQVVDKNNTNTIVLRLGMSGAVSSEIETATADVSNLNAEYKLRIRNYSVGAVRTGNVYSLKLLAT